MAGGAICLSPFENDDRIGAILFTGYPGQSGGVAISEVVTGKQNPSGRLTQTFYSAKVVDEISFFEMGFRANGSSSPGRTYRFYSGDSVVYPFGHGLSFSELIYAFTEDVSDQNSIKVTVVNKDSARSAAASILLFLAPPGSAPAGSPIRSLRGFEKITLDASASESVTFSLDAWDFSLPDEDGNFQLVEGTWMASVAGSNDDDAAGASFSFKVASEAFI